MKLKSLFVVILALILLLTACGGGNQANSGNSGNQNQSAGNANTSSEKKADDKVYTLRFSHIHAEGQTSKALAAELFEKEVEEKSGGRIQVEIYPNAVLYGDQEGLQALQNGALEMLAPASGIMTTVAPEIGVLDLPFLVDPDQTLKDILVPGSEIWKTFYANEKLESNGIMVLGVWDYGFKQIWSNKAIRSMDDMKGQKLRIVGGSNVLRDQMEAWGASPTPMALGEVYNALQQGVIDGFDNGYSSTNSMKAYEVLKYVTLTNHGYNAFLHIINKKFFDSLPEDLQKVVLDAAEAAALYNEEVALKMDEEAKEAIVSANTTEFIELGADELQKFKDTVIPSVWQQSAGEIGQAVIDELLASKNN